MSYCLSAAACYARFFRAKFFVPLRTPKVSCKSKDKITLRYVKLLLALGPIDPDIDLSSLGSLLIGTYDKTLFSMLTLEVETILKARPHIVDIVIFGIEVRFLSVLNLNHVSRHIICSLMFASSRRCCP